ncbi:DUF1566 domain-containing protein, partial [Nitrincola nitratireducens]|uniref:Lcl domain-containing protein n=3 Tax=Nitrincola TaxID=267849 RepID=UPI000685273C
VLIDFGAAKEELAEKSHSVVVTAGYGSPEQYSSKSKLSPSTDLYAVGATLYKCLTGQTPEEASARLYEDEHILLNQLPIAKQCPPGLVSLIDQCMQLKDKERPQGVQQAKAMLAQTTETPHPPEEPETQSQSKTESTETQPKKTSKAPILIGIAALLLLLGGGSYVYQQNEAEKQQLLTQLEGQRKAEAQRIAQAEEQRIAEAQRIAQAEEQPQVEEHRQHAIARSLQAAETALQANRLAIPEDDSALHHYRRVLELDPDNKQAKQGHEKIVERYIALAQEALRNGDLDRANLMLSRAEDVIPQSDAVNRVKAQVAEQRAADAQRQTAALIGGRYLDNEDGTITDTKTNLTWMRCRLGQTWTGSACSGEASRYNWQTAQDIAKQTTYAGKSDWRVPTLDQLHSLVYCSSGQHRERRLDSSGRPVQQGVTFLDGGCVGDYQYPTFFTDAFHYTRKVSWSPSVWSDSRYANHSHSAWKVDFSNGRAVIYDRYMSLPVRLVRGGQ